MTTELNKIGFEKCLQQLTKQKDKVVDTLRKDEQSLTEAKKTLQKVNIRAIVCNFPAVMTD